MIGSGHYLPGASWEMHNYKHTRHPLRAVSRVLAMATLLACLETSSLVNTGMVQAARIAGQVALQLLVA